MNYRSAGLLAALLLGLTACLSFTSSSPPPSYFQLSYALDPIGGGRLFDDTLRVWDLKELSPYDRQEMVVVDTPVKVDFSRRNRWVARPGHMVAQMLIRDLSRSSMFARLVTPLDPNPAPFQLGGHLFEFAREGAGSSCHAVIDAEIVFWRESPKRKVLLHKHYHFESPGESGDNPDLFAAGMSDAMRRFSSRLRDDIRATRTDSSSQDDD